MAHGFSADTLDERRGSPLNSAARVAVRTLAWVGAAGAAGTAIIVIDSMVGPIIFSALAPLSGYGNSASPLFTMEAFDLVAPLVSGFTSAILLIGGCLLLRLPLRRTLVSVATGAVGVMLWTTAVYGYETALLGMALGVALGGVSIAGAQRLLVRPVKITLTTHTSAWTR
jgi:hypothetical protein